MIDDLILKLYPDDVVAAYIRYRRENPLPSKASEFFYPHPGMPSGF